MKILNININDNIVEIDKKYLTSCTFNYIKCCFSFSSEWDEYDKIAIFTIDNKAYKKAIVDGECIIPHEIAEESAKIYVGVYGNKIENDVLESRCTSNLDYFRISRGAYDKDALESEALADISSYELYISKMNEILEETKQTLNDSIQIKTDIQALATRVLEQIKTQAQSAENEAIDNIDKEYQSVLERIEQVYITKKAEIDKTANDIANMKQSVETSEANAKTSETNAKQSETNAKTSETNAQNSANKAIESENNIIEIEKNIKAIQKDVQANKEATDTNVATTNANVIEATNQAKIAKEQADISTANASQTDADKTEVETMKNDVSLKINEFNLNSEALKNKVISTRNELKRVKDAVLETADASGSYITLNDSVMAEYQELSVDGVCEQEVIKGYNILDSKITSKNIYGVEIKVNDDKSFVCNGTAEETIVVNLLTDLIGTSDSSGNLVLTDSDINFIFSGCTGGGSKTYKLDIWTKWSKNICTNINGDSSFNITDEIDREIGRVRLVIYKGSTLDNVIFKPMIKLSSISDSNYEPYTGGISSPNPENPAPISTIENSLKITSCNKNWFDINNEVYGNIIPNYENGKISWKNTTGNYEFIEYKVNCKPNTKYYFSYTNKNTQLILAKKINVTDAINWNVVKDYSYITQNNMKEFYIRIVGNSAKDFYIENLQIEESSTATTFVEHIESQITANLPDGEFIGKINDTYKDALKVEYNETDGQYHLMLYKMLKKYTFTGNENVALNITNSDYIEFIISNLNLNPSNFLPTVSNYFLYNLNNRIAISNNGIYIRVPVSCGIDTVDKFKAFLLSNEVYVYYVLATHYMLDLGIVDMPLSYNEKTNLFTDSNLMPTINAKNYKSFINNMKNLESRVEQIESLLNTTSTSSLLLDNLQSDLESEVSE